MFGLGWNVEALKLPKGSTLVPKHTQPLEGAPPQHPGVSVAPACMHDDAGATDTSPFGGPVTDNVDAKYLHRWALIGGICPAFAFDAEGRPITMSFSALRTDLLLLDPRTLDVLDALPLPRRKGTIKKMLRRGLDEVFRDTSGGAYFFVDAAGRVVVPAADGQIWVVAIKREGKARRFEVLRKFRPHIAKGDKLTACLPVWRERGAPLYWYTTADGIIGIVGDGISTHLTLPNREKIQNSIAVNERGAFVVSNFALYLITMDAGAPKIAWRTPYDRGTTLKPGQIDLGSGRTPTLMDSRFVVIGDGSAPMRVLVIDQASGRILDAQPVFADKRGSASENSVIAHADTIVVGNTYGYENPLRAPRTEGGLVCFDVDHETGRMKQRWYKPEIDVFTATPKLSRKNGLIYAYSRRSLGRSATSKPTVQGKEREEWSVLGIDFRTGELVYRLPLFRGEHHTHYDNAWGTISLGPNDAAYLGMWNGCVMVTDPASASGLKRRTVAILAESPVHASRVDRCASSSSASFREGAYDTLDPSSASLTVDRGWCQRARARCHRRGTLASTHPAARWRDALAPRGKRFLRSVIAHGGALVVRNTYYRDTPCDWRTQGAIEP